MPAHPAEGPVWPCPSSQHQESMSRQLWVRAVGPPHRLTRSWSRVEPCQVRCCPQPCSSQPRGSRISSTLAGGEVPQWVRCAQAQAANGHLWKHRPNPEPHHSSPAPGGHGRVHAAQHSSVQSGVHGTMQHSIACCTMQHGTAQLGTHGTMQRSMAWHSSAQCSTCGMAVQTTTVHAITSLAVGVAWRRSQGCCMQ